MITNSLFVLALTFAVAPAATSFSIDSEGQWKRNLMFSLILSIGQGIMYTLGMLLGGTFMHLLEKYSKVVVFVFCIMIAFRMILDTIKIKKGGRLFVIDNKKHLIMLAMVLGINAFIAGLMADFFMPFGNMAPYILIGAGFFWSILASFIPFSKNKLIFSSLLNLFFAIIILLVGILELV